MGFNNGWLPIEEFDPDKYDKVFICDIDDKWVGAVLTYWTSSWTGYGWAYNLDNPTQAPIVPTHFYPFKRPPLPTR